MMAAIPNKFFLFSIKLERYSMGDVLFKESLGPIASVRCCVRNDLPVEIREMASRRLVFPKALLPWMTLILSPKAMWAES
jgi:hypothetical protein